MKEKERKQKKTRGEKQTYHKVRINCRLKSFFLWNVMRTIEYDLFEINFLPDPFLRCTIIGTTF